MKRLAPILCLLLLTGCASFRGREGHTKWRTFAYTGQAADAGFTMWACNQGYGDINPLYQQADCSDQAVALVVSKALFLGVAELVTRWELKKCGGTLAGCSDKHYRHLNIAWGAVGVTGWGPFALSVRNVAVDGKEDG